MYLDIHKYEDRKKDQPMNSLANVEIQEKEDTQLGEQRLRSVNRDLEDSQTLSYYGIKN